VSEIAPVRREVTVGIDSRAAFALFTDRIGDWWPVAELSVFGDGSSVGFEDGQIIERSGGQASEWGTVTSWQPGERVSFTWHPGAAAETASAVTVTFTDQGADQTLVILEHAGWEVFADPEAARGEYDHGWSMVLVLYRRAAAQDRGPELDTWVALMHRPGPKAPHGGSLFDDPRFGDHVEFLNRMRDEGYLVAAGPLLDEAGFGMTVLRLPGTGRLEDARRLATDEDASVKGGFFDVTVRPWRVLMSR
jgi:uncharacterized protein YciI/uncharacterized protein YndB with AHSA1/START domain